MRLDIRRIGAIKETAAAADKKEPAVIGNRTRVKVVKNKMAPPFREVEFDILYGQGISRSGDVVDLATDLAIVEKAGAWYSYRGERIGQGRENAKAYLEQHPEMMARMETEILAKNGLKRPGVPSDPDDGVKAKKADKAEKAEKAERAEKAEKTDKGDKTGASGAAVKVAN